MRMGCLYCQCVCCIGEMRFVVATFALFAVLQSFAQRAALNIAIVEMVEHELKNATCPNGKKAIVIKDIGGGRVNWSEAEQGYNLGAFFVGYVIAHIPAGILCDVYGPKYPLLCGMFFSSVSTACIPLAATLIQCWGGVCFLRIVTGLSQGALAPAISSLITRWIPPLERTSITAIVFAANSLGIVLGHVCTGMLIMGLQSWPVAFYLWAGIGVLYCMLFIVYVFSDPRTHPYIHESELDYLKQTMVMKTDVKTPYKKILSDRCVYGIIIMEMGHDLLLYTLMSNFPKYLNQVLGLDIMENSMVGFLFLLQWAAGCLGGLLADYLIRKKNINVTIMRKSYTYVSNFGAYTCLCFGVLSRCRMEYAILSFAMAIFFNGLYYSGGMVNILDISINHSGFVMSVVNGVGASMGCVCSVIIGIVAEHNTFYEWEVILGILGILEVTSLLFYSFLSNARRRDWDYSEDDAIEIKRRKKWYKQWSNSEHEMHLEHDRLALEAAKEQARVAKARLKDNLRIFG